MEEEVSQDQNEVEQRSQGSSGDDDGVQPPREGRRGGVDVKGDVIETGSPISEGEESESAPGHEDERLVSIQEADGDVTLRTSEDSSPTQRRAKRRKLSITPLPAFSSSPAEPQAPRSVRADEKENTEDQVDDTSTSPSASAREEEEHNSDADADTDARLKAQQQNQPTFRPPPRFKPTEDALPLGDGLPAAFSPQRRGAKYLTGGLAAELQGWLSEVKGEDDGPAGSTLKMRVEEVRQGRRMYLVHGRLGDSSDFKKVVLAGEGRLTGLGGRAVVGVGSVVEVGQPVWDVVVEGETWMVACDWTAP